jgi:hypothetical protein
LANRAEKPYVRKMKYAAAITVLVCVSVLAGSTLGAQCPDGSPPPCGGARAAPIRRADPPLDGDKWMVVPFDNLANAADVEWLRDASANLLYLDLARWQDIRVVDDERVRDLVRGTPALKGEKSVPLAVQPTEALKDS